MNGVTHRCSHHCVSFSWTCLSICKEADVVSSKCTRQHRSAKVLEHLERPKEIKHSMNNTSLYKHSSLLADLAPFITPWEQRSSHICLSVLSDSMLSAQHPLVRSSLRHWYAKHSADMEQQCLSASLPSISYFIPRRCEFLRIFLSPSVYSSHHKCDRKAWPRLFDTIT